MAISNKVSYGFLLLESGHGMLSLTDFRKSLFLGQTETSKLI
jgi:hypothetical protein